MSIKHRFFSTSFRFVSLYVVVYLFTTLSFLVLMFSIVGTEIEDKIKRDIERDFHDVVHHITADNSSDIEFRISERIASANPLDTLYILKTERGKIVATNYPYETNLGKGWVHLQELKDKDEPPEFEGEEESFFEDMSFYPENAHDEGYVGWNEAIGPYNLFVGQSLESISETKSVIARVAILVVPVSLLLAFLGGLIFNRMTTKRIEIINDHCRSIRKQGDLSLRVPNSRPDDEYGLLIANINAMLDTIDKGVQNIQTVSDDVAHDLRTPLSRLKYKLDSGRSDPNATLKSLKEVIENGLDETENLLETFSAILRISRLKSGQRKSKFQDFDLLVLIKTFHEAYSPSAEVAGHEMRLRSNMESCIVNGDKEMVGQLLSNLIENALHHASQHAREGLVITLALDCDHDSATLSVEDNGRGIESVNQNKVFDKFFRGDYSRQNPGNGLGLATVKAVAELHEAEVQLVPLNPGVKFLVTFSYARSSGK